MFDEEDMEMAEKGKPTKGIGKEPFIEEPTN
jgi:hypothetical protein